MRCLLARTRRWQQALNLYIYLPQGGAFVEAFVELIVPEDKEFPASPKDRQSTM